MATKPWEDSPPTIGERYAVAAGSSNLTGFGGMVPEGYGSAHVNVLIAAGLHDMPLGQAIMRLESEWDASAKPVRPGPRLLQALAGYVKREDDEARETAHRNDKPWSPPKESAAVRAQQRANAWFDGELRLLAVSLKSRKEVLKGLTEWAAVKGIRPEAASEAIMKWLDPRCPSCHGHGLIGPKQCHPCHGTGNSRIEDDAGRLMRHMDYVVGVAKGNVSKALA
jgi:hypothetical protein